jgi:phytoene/squalene synthetase
MSPLPEATRLARRRAAPLASAIAAAPHESRAGIGTLADYYLHVHATLAGAAGRGGAHLYDVAEFLKGIRRAAESGGQGGNEWALRLAPLVAQGLPPALLTEPIDAEVLDHARRSHRDRTQLAQLLRPLGGVPCAAWCWAAGARGDDHRKAALALGAECLRLLMAANLHADLARGAVYLPLMECNARGLDIARIANGDIDAAARAFLAQECASARSRAAEAAAALGPARAFGEALAGSSAAIAHAAEARGFLPPPAGTPGLLGRIASLWRKP